MSSYHSSFTYLGHNSSEDYDLIISHINNADNGIIDSYLSIDAVYRESYRGTRRNVYGTKYNEVFNLEITVLHKDYGEFNIQQTRNIYRWLTGTPNCTWIDLYDGDEVKYRIHGYVKDVKPYKMDARIIGFTIYVESSSPWCYSPLIQQKFAIVGSREFAINCDSDELYNYIPLNVQFSKEKENSILYDDYEEKLLFDGQLLGVTYDSSARELKLLKVLSEYNGISRTLTIDTSSIQPTSKVNELSITNMDIEESGLLVKNIDNNENLTISENMMIQSSNKRIFGNDFNYIFPRLKSGQNTFNVTGNGYLTFKYTIPIKVGDCVDNYLS